MNKILMAVLMIGSQAFAVAPAPTTPIPTVQILYDPSGPSTLLNEPLHFEISASGAPKSSCSGNTTLSTTTQTFQCPGLLNITEPVTLDLRMSITPSALSTNPTPLSGNCASTSFPYKPGQIILVGIQDVGNCGAIATTPTQSSAPKRK